MKPGRSEQLTPPQQAEIDALAAVPDDEIDTKALLEVHAGVVSSAASFFGRSKSSSRSGLTPT